LAEVTGHVTLSMFPYDVKCFLKALNRHSKAVSSFQWTGLTLNSDSLVNALIPQCPYLKELEWNGDDPLNDTSDHLLGTLEFQQSPHSTTIWLRKLGSTKGALSKDELGYTKDVSSKDEVM